MGYDFLSLKGTISRSVIVCHGDKRVDLDSVKVACRLEGFKVRGPKIILKRVRLPLIDKYKDRW